MALVPTTTCSKCNWHCPAGRRTAGSPQSIVELMTNSRRRLATGKRLAMVRDIHVGEAFFFWHTHAKVMSPGQMREESTQWTGTNTQFLAQNPRDCVSLTPYAGHAAALSLQNQFPPTGCSSARLESLDKAHALLPSSITPYRCWRKPWQPRQRP